MKTSDIEGVVQVHLQSFAGFFLSFLGEGFLKELYTAILCDPSGMAFVYDEEGSLLGFAAGTGQPAGFYRRLLSKRLPRFFLASVIPVLKQPSIIPRLLRAFNAPVQADVGASRGILMSIAVSPEAQGKGIGRQLLQAFLNEADARGLIEVNLTTDRLNNELVNRFYQANGFCLVRSYVTPEGRAMNEYRILCR